MTYAVVWREDGIGLSSSHCLRSDPSPVLATANCQPVDNKRINTQPVTTESAAALPGPGGATCQPAVVGELPDSGLPGGCLHVHQPVVWGRVRWLHCLPTNTGPALRSRQSAGPHHQEAPQAVLILDRHS